MVGTSLALLCPPYARSRRMTVFAGFASFRTGHNGGRLESIEEASSQEAMKLRRLLWSALGVVALLIAICGGWIVSLPPAPSVKTPPEIAQDEHDATIAALKP